MTVWNARAAAAVGLAALCAGGRGPAGRHRGRRRKRPVVSQAQYEQWFRRAVELGALGAGRRDGAPSTSITPAKRREGGGHW